MESKEEETVTTTATTTLEPDDESFSDFTFDRQRSKFGYINYVGDYIVEKIPNFKYIWPLLEDYTEEGKWHDKLDEDLEFIGTAHYTVLKSLCYILRNKDLIIPHDPDQKYKNVIFHYALIVDCIKQICFHIVRFKHKLDPSIDIPLKKKTKEEFIKLIDTWYKKYNTDFESFKNSGGLVFKTIHNVQSCIKSLNGKKNFTSFNKFKSSKIEPLRNTFIHNPSIDIFWIGKEMLVVKPEFIKSNKIIGTIKYLSRENLIEPKILMDDLFNEATEMLNQVWTAFYDEILWINSHENFENKRVLP